MSSDPFLEPTGWSSCPTELVSDEARARHEGRVDKPADVQAFAMVLTTTSHKWHRY